MSTIKIAGDPASWELEAGTQIPAIMHDLMTRSAPVALNVTGPLSGRLLLSTKAAGFAALLTPPAGWIPGGVLHPEPVLYVPSATGPTITSHGYGLPASTNLVALEEEILSAMAHGTAMTVEITGSVVGGGLVLNGSTLPFVVVCPAYAGR